jgi:hypothetical protein
MCVLSSCTVVEKAEPLIRAIDPAVPLQRGMPRRIAGSLSDSLNIVADVLATPDFGCRRHAFSG